MDTLSKKRLEEIKFAFEEGELMPSESTIGFLLEIIDSLQNPTQVTVQSAKDLPSLDNHETVKQLSDFIFEYCLTSGKKSTLAKRVELKNLYQVYCMYCDDLGELCLARNVFSQALNERGYSVRPGAKNKRFVYGIQLNEAGSARLNDVESEV